MQCHTRKHEGKYIRKVWKEKWRKRDAEEMVKYIVRECSGGGEIALIYLRKWRTKQLLLNRGQSQITFVCSSTLEDDSGPSIHVNAC